VKYSPPGGVRARIRRNYNKLEAPTQVPKTPCGPG
jgi:hypothetical protein